MHHQGLLLSLRHRSGQCRMVGSHALSFLGLDRRAHNNRTALQLPVPLESMHDASKQNGGNHFYRNSANIITLWVRQTRNSHPRSTNTSKNQRMKQWPTKQLIIRPCSAQHSEFFPISSTDNRFHPYRSH
uniref:Uncharacterized protein n=1 Tax=Arundo donax TaxID=35708 RepID=A0A0A9CXP2_ARUDO